MIPELGHFALILALCATLAQSTLPLIGTLTRNGAWTALAVPAARTQFVLLLIAFAALTYGFITHDYSVAYVANNSNNEQPLMYRISAVWGAHEGSLLLWALILAGWTVAVSFFSRSMPAVFTARVIAVIGLISVGFILFMLMTSNPFDRLLPAPFDGRELNPLLQDPGLAIHPPMLYMGYVGFAVPFAFAIAGLIDGRLDAAWTRWSRPWTAVAWAFLTAGIALGSWWAYYELGWGGWWFWDPVENASFMPWLVGTALLHSLAVTEKRNAFKAWTVLLAIFAFSLSLLGTFLVRSGVLVSVHAFASDPARGVFILIFLGLVVGTSLALFAWRGATISSGGRFKLLSRETFLLVNNVLLVVAAGSILLGTLYPVILDTLDLGKLSVGRPYFNAVFVPLMVPLVFLMGVGPVSRWKRDEMLRLARSLRVTLGISVALSIGLLLISHFEMRPMVLVGILASVWVVLMSLRNVWKRVNGKSGITTGVRKLPLDFIGMQLAHIGIAVVVVGITLATAFSTEKDIRMEVGDSVELDGFVFTFEGIRQVRGPNFRAEEGTVRVSRNDVEETLLYPQKRHYATQSGPMTEAAIDSGFSRDLYVALGDLLPDGAWTLRVYYKPFIQWLWIGAMLMALGGLLAAADRRYRVRVKSRETSPATAQEKPSKTAEANA